MTYKFKLLSIDGGGIRGIIPAKILAEVEKRTGKRIFELFDLIAGTSTGGILALGLAKPHPDKPNEARYTAQELVELYRNNGQQIFSKRPESALEKFAEQQLSNVFKQFRLPNIDPDELVQSKYPADGREKVLTKYFGDTPIETALKDVLVTSYDTELRTPVFFIKSQDEEKIGENFRKICSGLTMKQAAMATSAAPTFFPPVKIPTTQKTDNGYYSLVDGGVFANNPTALAIMEAIISYRKRQKEKLNIDEILVVSMGTGSLIRKYPYDQAVNWGQLKWVQPVLDIALDGQSESVACQLEQLLPYAEDIPKQYYRFQGMLTKANDNMDDATPDNIKKLETLAELIIKERNKDLNELCEQLIALA